MVKKVRQVIAGSMVALGLLTAGSAYADLQDDIMTLVGDNATSYIHPLTNSLGVAMNSGWYNSSKSYKFLMLPFGVQLNVGLPLAMINDDLRTYDFNGEIQTANLGLSATEINLLGLSDVLEIRKDDVPTVVGDEGTTIITLEEVLLANGVSEGKIDTASSGGVDVTQEIFALPGGIKHAAELSFIPMSIPVLSLNVGLPFKVQVGLRLLPETDIPDFGKVSQFGMKFQYEFTQLLPVLGKLPLLHTSAHYAFNNAEMLDILELNNWQVMLNASADLSFIIGLGVYGSIGYQQSTMSLNYTVPDGVMGAGTEVDLQDMGDNSIVTQVGARLTLSVIDVVADITLGKTTSYYVGVGVGLNGL